MEGNKRVELPPDSWYSRMFAFLDEKTAAMQAAKKAEDQRRKTA
jgi:hypothetical protein